MRLSSLSVATAALLPLLCSGQVPIFKVVMPESKITFNVKASVSLAGTFEEWDASLRFSSADVETGVLEIQIQAASVDTGSGIRNATLKSRGFFDVNRNPLITFRSTRIVPIGPDKYRIEGDFTLRGVTKPETITLSVAGDANGTSGRIEGQMAFDRKDYGMTRNIPFIEIADRVEVDLNLTVQRTSGPPVTIQTKSGE